MTGRDYGAWLTFGLMVLTLGWAALSYFVVWARDRSPVVQDEDGRWRSIRYVRAHRPFRTSRHRTCDRCRRHTTRNRFTDY